MDALNGLRDEFNKHPIALKPDHAYSPASIAKSYLEANGDKTAPSEVQRFQKGTGHRDAELLRRGV